MKNKIIVAGVACALIFGGGGFYGGMKYAQGKKTVGGNGANFANLSQADRQQRFSQMGGGQGAGRAGGAQAGAGFVNGEVIAKDDKSITVKLGDSGSKIIFYSTSTKLQKMTDTPIGDLAVGGQVMVTGTTNSDGSVTAQTIQLRPEVRLGESPAVKSIGN